MRIFAFYLPQFHEILENNAWWGEGYTEWTSVKSAKPLFSGHNQPEKPLFEKYYNLLDKSTVLWQTSLMHEYCVDGFIYYHYYFEGRKLLERPAENLLKWKEIKQPFFFCWANHSWKKTWNGTQEMLVEQTYGGEKSWKEHFDYLLPFFRDERYEKINNKPVLMLFKSDFPEKNKIMSFFNDCCLQNGFKGIYIIESVHNIRKKPANALNKDVDGKYFYREPTTSLFNYLYSHNYPIELIKWKTKRALSRIGVQTNVLKYSANDLYNSIGNYDYSDAFPGAFLSWDNTPRHKNNGYIITPPSKTVFFHYLDTVKDNDYLFINAWNEWAEGMVLEPTERLGYTFLEWIKEWQLQNKNESH